MVRGWCFGQCDDGEVSAVDPSRAALSSRVLGCQGWPWRICQAQIANTKLAKVFPEYALATFAMNNSMRAVLAGQRCSSEMALESQKT